MKIPFKPTPSMNFHFMALNTDWIERVEDDGLWMLQASVENGDFNKERKNHLQLKVLDKSADVDALAFGGLAIFSNVKKTAIRKALLVGIDYLMKTGQLSQEDFLPAPKDE